MGFPDGTSGKESTCQCRRHKRCRFNPWVRKISCRRKWQLTSVLLPGKFLGQRSLAGQSLWFTKSHTRMCTHLFTLKIQCVFTKYILNFQRRQWHPTPVLLPGKSHGRRSLVGCSPWLLSEFTFTFHFPALEKAMATHSSVLAWRIPGTGDPGGLQSMGSLRVRHDWATSFSLFTFMHWRRQWQPTPVFLPGESQGWGSSLWWAALYGVAQSWTWLKWLSSSSSRSHLKSKTHMSFIRKSVKTSMERCSPNHWITFTWSRLLLRGDSNEEISRFWSIWR